MPLHIQPKLRALEEARESNGLVQTQDSRGVTIQKAKENAATVTKLVPKETIWIRGSKYTPA